MDSQEAITPQTIQLTIKQIIPPKLTDNHIRSLVFEAKREYISVPNPANPESNIKIGMTTHKSTYWQW